MEGKKKKKPIFKRWWFIALVFIIVVGVIGSGGEDEPEDVTKEPIKQTVAPVDGEVKETEKTEPLEVVVEAPVADVPRELKNALKSAQNYVDIMPFSEAGLYNQLTSEHGGKFPAEAVQYAIENVDVNYNEEALESAKNYQEVMPMSDQDLFDQLTSEHGEQFTKEQAQYAIDNLPE